MSLKDQRQALVDTFINAIYLYDDKVLITFNYKEGTQTVTFGEAAEAASKGNGSDLNCIPAPRKTSTRCVLVFLFVCTMEGARTGRRRAAPQAISPVGCCLARGSHPIGMSNVEAVRECREIERFHGFFAFSAWHAGSFAPRPKTAPFPEKQHNPRERFPAVLVRKCSRGLLFYSALLCRAGFEARRFYAFTSRFCSRRYASANIAASQSTQLKKNSAYWPASMSVLRLAFMPACIRA